jgi:hypothetical protein
MMIFLSYASEQRDLAEEVKHALTATGHQVFFDRESLPIGEDYHSRIRNAVGDCEAFVFLISPQSVAQGCYTLTELKYAREKWPEPRGKVLPVMAEKTDYRQIPPYLKSISVLEPEGNAPAEIAAEIQNWTQREFQDAGGLNAHRLKRIPARFVAILAHPRRFFRSIDYHSDQSLVDATLFAVVISVINLVLLFPAHRIAQLKSDTLSYVLIDTVITLLFWFLYGSVYHLCARLLGGRGTYPSSLVAVLYLTAFTVVSQIFTLPVSLKAISLGLESSEIPSFEQFRVLGEQTLQTPVGLICSFLSTVTISYRWVVTIMVFMIIHDVGLLKGIGIGVLGAALSWVLFFGVELPATQLLWRAFSF